MIRILRACLAVATAMATLMLNIEIGHSASALAVGSCGAHGYAVARRLGEAENIALRYCYRFGGKDCVIRAWLCDAKG
jgi:hypothetical protein